MAAPAGPAPPVGPGPIAPVAPVAQVFQPRTRRAGRAPVRGDFGPVAPDPQNLYPAQGAHVALQDAFNQLANSQPCNPNAAGVMPGLPAEVMNAPPGEQCILAVKHTVEQASRNIRTADQRSIRLPRVGDNDPMANGQLAQWPADRSRPFYAKKCLDRAMQMYQSAGGKLRKIVEANGQNATTHPQFAVSLALAFSVTPNNAQLPRQNKQSALWLLYMAYRLIRDVEMNPRPPQGADGQPNPMRATEDSDYKMVMGTRRMLPNRLGLGPQAEALQQAGAAPLTGPNRPIALYGQITSDDARDGAAAGTPADEVPAMAQCLENLHLNFPPPTAQVPAAPANPQQAPPRIDSWAALGEPYPAGRSPFPQLPANYVPIFFPSGRSMNGEAPARPPYNPNLPQPLVGEPDPVATPFWDARYAVAMLKTHTRRLEEIALQAEQKGIAEVEEQARKVDPQAPIVPMADQLPLRYWPGGPEAVTAENPTHLPAAAKDAGLAILPGPFYTRQPGPIQTVRIDPATAFARRPGNQPPRSTIVRAGNPAERNRVPTGSIFPYGAPPSSLPTPVDPNSLVGLNEARRTAMIQHALYQLDGPRTEWQTNHLPRETWTTPPAGNLVPGARWGDAAPAAGLRRRLLDGRMDASHRGWAAYVNPIQVAQPVEPPPDNRPFAQRWATRTGQGPNTRGRERPQVAADSVPIGPLLVDPLFGATPQNVPSRAGAQEIMQRYADPNTPAQNKPRWLCFVRTNQVRVEGTNSFGLDFLWPGLVPIGPA